MTADDTKAVLDIETIALSVRFEMTKAVCSLIHLCSHKKATRRELIHISLLHQEQNLQHDTSSPR